MRVAGLVVEQLVDRFGSKTLQDHFLELQLSHLLALIDYAAIKSSILVPFTFSWLPFRLILA